MKRATITLPSDLAEAVDEFTAQQEVEPTLTALVQAALRQFLARRGFGPPAKLELPVAEAGSGYTDTSVEHDAVLAEATAERKLPRL